MLCKPQSCLCPRSAAARKTTFLLAWCCLALCQTGLAQTAQFAYATALSGLNNPSGVAVDSIGTLYIVDLGNGRILKETPAGGGYTRTVVAGAAVGTPLYGPFGVAVDRSGNVYIADRNPVTSSTDPYYQQYRILKETPAGTVYTQSVIKASPSYAPYGVAVDASGNVFVVEGTAPTAGASRIVKETFASSAWTESVVVVSLPYSEAYGIAVDAAGDLFVTNTQLSNTAAYSAVYKETPVSGTYTQSMVGSGLNFPYGVAVDGTGNVYVTDSNSILLETPSGSTYNQSVMTSLASPQGVAVDGNGAVYVASGSQILQIAGGINFGAQNTASTSGTRTLTFHVAGTATIGSTAVLTQGAAGLDFADAGGSTCTASASGPTCTINVSFTPKAAGLRCGAVNLYDSGGNLLATAYLYGTGVGPQVAYSPGTQSVVTTNSGLDPYGMAVDGNGSVYFCDRGHGQVFQETLRAGGWSRRTVASNLGTPSGVAVDGAGNVYIADVQNGAIYKATPLPSGAFAAPGPVITNLSAPWAVTVDGGGNLYVLDTGAGRALRETASPAGYIQSEIDYGIYDAYEIAVDPAGNVYIDDQYTENLYKETPSSGTYTRSLVSSTLGYVNGLAVDGTGDIYVANGGDVTELKPAASGSGYTSSVLVTGLNSPSGLAVDGGGNLYIADEFVGTVYKQDLTDPPSLSFAGTAVGGTSSDSPKSVTLQNIGNAPLSFSVPSTGTNPSVSSNFSLSVSSTCPQLTPSSSVASLAAGASCTELLSFVPTQAGTIAGSLVTTNNNLNAAGATQSVQLTGTGTPGATTLTVSPVSVMQGAANTTLTASVSYGGVAPTGTVTFAVDSGSTVTATCSASSFTRTCMVRYPTGSLAAGSRTIAVTEAADTNYAAVSATGSLTVTQATDGISVSPASVVYGTASTALTATVAYSGSVAPSGGVSFSVDGGAPVTAVCAGTSSFLTCTASYTTFALNSGSHTVLASVAADTNYSATSGTITLTVTPATATISVNSVSVVYGTSSATLSATLGYTGSAAPGGGVSFSVDGGAAVAGVCSGSSSSVLACGVNGMTSALNAGIHTITVSLAADANYSAAVRGGTLTITQATPVVIVASPSIVYGTTSATLSATVAYTGGAAPNGGLSFSVDGGAVIMAICMGGSSPLTCTASYPTSRLSGGTHTLVARQAVGTNYTAATSPAGTLTVTRAPLTVAVSGPTVVLGTASTTVSVTVAYTGAAAPTGGLNVVVDSGAAVTASCSSGASPLVCTANYPTTALAVGAHTLTATALADVNYTSAVGTGGFSVSDATLFPSCTLSVSAAATSSAITATPTCTDPQNQPLTLMLNWGDGSSQAAANQAATPHTYANLAVATPYTVNVTATDSGGRSSSASRSILVVPSVPVASPGAPAQITTTLSSQPPTLVPTLVTFVCASVSTAMNGQTATTLPSQYGISCTSPQVDASKTPLPVSVTVQTTAATTPVAQTAFSNNFTAFCVVLLPFGTLLSWRRRNRTPLLAGGCLLVLCLLLSSCGGSFTPPPTIATPQGSYYLTITEVVVGDAPAPTGFVQTSLIVPITVGK